MNVKKWNILLRIILVFLPFIMMLTIVVVGGWSGGMYHPFNSDELSYWRECYNFYASNTKVTGLNIYAGYETRLGNFSSHGCSPFILWYLPGMLMGWHYWSIPVINAMYMSLAFILFCLKVKPSNAVLVKIIIAYSCLGVVWLYCLSSMAEMPQYAIILVWFLLLTDKERKPKDVVILFLFYTLCGLVRIIYFVFFFPILIIVMRTYRKNVARIIVIMPFIIVSVITYYLGGGDVFGIPLWLFDTFI